MSVARVDGRGRVSIIVFIFYFLRQADQFFLFFFFGSCMTPTTLIFQDTGPKHTAMRQYMIKALAGLAKKDPGFQSELLDVPMQEDPKLASDILVKTGKGGAIVFFFAYTCSFLFLNLYIC